MSGLYGLYLANNSENTIQKNISILRNWNRAFGDEMPVETAQNNIGLGISPIHDSVSPCNTTPLLRKDSLIAVIDAVLYNRGELLQKSGLSSNLSDEALLLEYIQAYGYDALAEINGDFAGAVYDTALQELTLFRDHMGIRPLYFYQSDSMTAFSSDIRGLIALPEIPDCPNPDWLYKYVCGFDETTLNGTEYRNIFRVQQASYLRIHVHQNSLQYDEHIYWKLGKHKIRMHSEEEYCRKLNELITDSVRRRADAYPGVLGAELSGGLDSGVIDILLNRLGHKGSYFSWSFSPDELPLVPNDERQVIADICEQEGITCAYGNDFPSLYEGSYFANNHAIAGLPFDKTLSTEAIFAFPPFINTTIICDTADYMRSQGAHVIFTGHGGDEGVSHRCDPYEMYYHHEYYHFLKHYWDNNKGKKRRLIKTLRQAHRKIKKGREYRKIPFQTLQSTPKILAKEFANGYDDSKMPVLTFSFDSIAYVYSGNTHVRPDVTGLLGPYSGVRYVFPYLDYRVIDYAVSIPRYLYLKGDMKRYIFRQAFKDIMPESLYTCTAKNNPSEENLPEKDGDWFELSKPHRERIARSLNREYWKPYLDFEVIDQWATCDRPSTAEEKDCFLKTIHKLNNLLSYQQMIERVKKANQ